MYETTCSRIRETKIVAILRRVPEEKLLKTVRALYAGGIRVLEITLDHAVENCAERAASAIAMCSEALGLEASVGAGTVLSPEEVGLVAQAGAKLIVSPNTDPAVIRETRERGLVSCPGALTPSEIVSAWSAGASFVKLFPAEQMGCAYIKALRGPLPHILLLAVGGADADNASEFLRAGACGLGVGGKLVNAKLIAEDDFEGLTALARRFREAVK